MIGAGIGFLSMFIFPVLFFVTDMAEYFINWLAPFLNLAYKLHLPTGMGLALVLIGCAIWSIIGLRRKKIEHLLMSLFLALFSVGYMLSGGFAVSYLFAALVGYILGFIFYKPRVGVIIFVVFALLCIKPVIYATNNYNKFLQESEEAKEKRHRTVKELAEYFRIDEGIIRMIVEKYGIGGTADINSTNWRYSTKRVEEALKKEGLIKNEGKPTKQN